MRPSPLSRATRVAGVAGAFISTIAATFAIARPASAQPAVTGRSTASIGPALTMFGAARGVSFRLPWGAGASQYLTQDANDDCCGDHVGANKFAYDFALPSGGAFDVVAPAAGTIVHVKTSSNHGCGDASCVNDANYVVIDHGDGTQTTMLHLAYGSLDPSVTCGQLVRRGQRLATTGSTGWSTGIHLHVERDQVRRDLKKTCECGANGMDCAPRSVEWSLFWPSASQPNVAIDFDEWRAAPTADNRRGLIGPSLNGDDREDIVTVDVGGRFSALSGDWAEAEGGRRGTFQVARSGSSPSGALSLKGVLLRPGIYEVWAYVPLSRFASARVVSVEVQGVGNAQRGTMTQTSVGGAFHPVPGLERVRLLGGANERIVLSAVAGDANDTSTLAVDSIALRRVRSENDDRLLMRGRAPRRPGSGSGRDTTHAIAMTERTERTDATGGGLGIGRGTITAAPPDISLSVAPASSGPAMGRGFIGAILLAVAGAFRRRMDEKAEKRA